MKRIFLTGASSGIGLATAQAAVARGHEVWGTSRDPARLPSLGRFHPVRLDLADFASVRDAFEQAWRESQGIDVLINNAGGGHFDAAEFLPHEKVEELFRTLVFSHMELCRVAFTVMSDQTVERTVVVVNSQGFHARPAHLFAQSAALEATTVLRGEFTVTAACPVQLMSMDATAGVETGSLRFLAGPVELARVR